MSAEPQISPAIRPTVARCTRAQRRILRDVSSLDSNLAYDTARLCANWSVACALVDSAAETFTQNCTCAA